MNEQYFGIGYNSSGTLFVDTAERIEDPRLVLSREALEQLKQSIEFALKHYPQVENGNEGSRE